MTEPIYLDILGLVFFTALFLSLFFVPVTIILARRVGAVDVPKGRSSHLIPTTRLGGLGIAGSLIISCLMFLPSNDFSHAFLAGLLAIVVTGLVDDIVDIGPRWKFVGQIAASSLFVWLGGVSLVHLGDFLGIGEITLTWFAMPFSIFCMVGGMNALNLSDGLDGLAAGLSAIAVVFLAYFSWHAGAADLLLVCLALLGALMGFLRYNSYPAKLFMGDCGSLTLGYVLTAVLVSGSQRNGHQIPLVAWAMVIALPLLDTLLVMGRRMYHGESPFLPDRTHLHHRLMALGFAHPGVVAVMYVAMACFGALSLFFLGYPEWYAFVGLFLTGIVLFGGVSGLQHFGFNVNTGRRKRTFTTVTQWPIYKRIAETITLYIVPVSVLIFSLISLPVLFFPLPELNHNEVLVLFMLAGGVVFYSFHLLQSNKGMLHGSIYVSIFVLIFLYNCGGIGDGHWPRIYLTTISVLTLLWVLVKIAFNKKMVVLKASGFELLMVLLSWFVPFVVFQEVRLPSAVVEAGRLACLQSLPFLLATKIYFNVQPQADRWVVGVLVSVIVIAALRGLV